MIKNFLKWSFNIYKHSGMFQIWNIDLSKISGLGSDAEDKVSAKTTFNNLLYPAYKISISRSTRPESIIMITEITMPKLYPSPLLAILKRLVLKISVDKYKKKFL